MSFPTSAPVNEVVIAAATGAPIAAFYADCALVGLELGGRATDRRVGEIILGRVRKVERALAAAFVEIGGNAFGFLNLADARGLPSPRRLPGEGEAILVQISREAEDSKAAKLTASIALPGRTLLYRPHRAGLLVSRRILDERRRGALLDLARSLPQDAGGWFIRRAALAASPDTMRAEAQTLLEQWRRLEERIASTAAPVRLFRPPDPILEAVADAAGPDLDRVQADDPGILNAIRAHCPEIAAWCRLECVARPGQVDAAVEAAVSAALEPAVALPGGGAVRISETPALVAIDVDAGNRRGGAAEDVALAANLEAVGVLARQIAVRGLAGHLTIDFIGMRRRAQRERVVAALRAAFAEDRQETHVAGYTRLGKVEMMRRRLHGSLRTRLTTTCSGCHGEGVVLSPEWAAHASLRAALRTGSEAGAAGAALVIAAAPGVADALRGAAAGAWATIERRLGRKVDLREDPTMSASTFRLETERSAPH
ncbi:MAG: ribonuclease E/G [Rhodospirillales bacterium]|nr:ribonuclease E/G [Rhodospirillales bacterium]